MLISILDTIIASLYYTILGLVGYLTRRFHHGFRWGIISCSNETLSEASIYQKSCCFFVIVDRVDVRNITAFSNYFRKPKSIYMYILLNIYQKLSNNGNTINSELPTTKKKNINNNKAKKYRHISEVTQ